jgi:hypothetical protein
MTIDEFKNYTSSDIKIWINVNKDRLALNQSKIDINTFLETSITKIEGLGPYAYLYFAAVSIYMYYKSTFCSSFFKPLLFCFRFIKTKN